MCACAFAVCVARFQVVLLKSPQCFPVVRFPGGALIETRDKTLSIALVVALVVVVVTLFICTRRWEVATVYLERICFTVRTRISFRTVDLVSPY